MKNIFSMKESDKVQSIQITTHIINSQKKQNEVEKSQEHLNTKMNN